MQRNITRGLNRLFVVFTVCWYLAAIPILWPKWSGSLWAQWQAHRIKSNSPNADGTGTLFPDEIEGIAKGDVRPAPPKDLLTISPMRFLAWLPLA
jgi:hypothetical protein